MKKLLGISFDAVFICVLFTLCIYFAISVLPDPALPSEPELQWCYVHNRLCPVEIDIHTVIDIDKQGRLLVYGQGEFYDFITRTMIKHKLPEHVFDIRIKTAKKN